MLSSAPRPLSLFRQLARGGGMIDSLMQDDFAPISLAYRITEDMLYSLK